MDDITLTKGFISKDAADHCFKHLTEQTFWTNMLRIKGSEAFKKIHREMAYMADEGVYYDYSNLQLPVISWTAEMRAIALRLSSHLKIDFNSVLLNKYRDGKDEIRWHSDKEEQLGDKPVIACINLGATRKFWFLEKATGNKFFHLVEHGDLLVMGENCQKKYLHAILQEKGVTEPRISLTFRKVQV